MREDMIKDRLARYVAGCLDGARQDVAGAAQGGRDARLLAAAMTLGALMGEGLASSADESALQDAGLAAGQPLAAVRSTLRSGLARGRAKGRAALPRQLQELLELAERSGLAAERPRLPEAPPARPRPPESEVAELWRRAGAVFDDHAVAAELWQRGLDPAEVTDEDLARALPAGPLPRWAWGPGGSWADTGHRLLLGLYDALGALRSIHARTLRQDLAEGAKKGLFPAGCAASGLILASALGRELLAAGAAPPSWNGDVLLAEGVPDFLRLATHHSDAAETAPAVFGYLQGAWTEAHAGRVPAASRALIWRHDDEGGARMAARVASTLAHARVLYVPTEAVDRG